MKTNPRIEKIKSILACPSCCVKLDCQQNYFLCASCQKQYPIRDGKLYFIDVPTYEDTLDSIKGKLKKWLGKYYYSIGVNVIAPTYPFNYLAELKKRISLTEKIVVDVGCGNHRIDNNIICMDMFDYDVVDIICDIEKLPFLPGSVDMFASRSVIEHIPYPNKLIEKIHQCTKLGGYSVHSVPFLFPFHASPYDFQRYTHKGLDILFADWEKIEQFNVTGPITHFLASITEFFSILFSFGNRRLQPMLYFGLCLLLFPLKYLDWFFVRSERYYSLASTFLMVAQKK
ncbi:hypothetical protein AYO45_01150 [Gammaproteobacteria bacterium SCGC AG-212-F23]|nr:hypothetical protein AYO45_01150 [Gammaproteobacteria bacterium SCGC AG-212-F23]